MRHIVLESFDGQCQFAGMGKVNFLKGIDGVGSVSKCKEECAACLAPYTCAYTCVAFAYHTDKYCGLYGGGPYTHGDSKKNVKCYLMKSGTLYMRSRNKYYCQHNKILCVN